MKGVRILWVLPLLVFSCGADKPQKYDAGLLKLASSVTAKEVCSCLYVMKRDEAFCTEWTRVSPDIAKFKVHEAEQSVTARAIFARSTARYVSEREGCVLER